MSSKGFTIIELLVSAAIFSLIITGMTLVLLQQQRQYNITQDIVDVDHSARAALDFISSEVRNAGSRQGKTFSFDFENGGSPQCDTNTLAPGTINSPPDCLTVYTWDITKGRDGDDMPSVPGVVNIASPGPDLVLSLPPEWFFVDGDPTMPRNPPLLQPGDLLGARSRFNLCYPNPDPMMPIVDCNSDPEKCTECSVILKVSSINAPNATIEADLNNIVEQNYREDDNDFAGFSDFVTTFFSPKIAKLASEVTIAEAKTFRVDPTNRELEMSQTFDDMGEPDQFQPLVGGRDAPGIVDLQFVFNIQGADGLMTKVGVPTVTANRKFANFEELNVWLKANPTPWVGSWNDIRSVEIYLVLRSQTRPRKLSGGFFRQNIPAVGDVAQKELTDPLPDPVEGYIYRVFSTTVYVRNLAREEFG